jgi:taurine dioxygenase
VRRISGALGAEVRGVDLRHVDDATWAELRALWLEHLVLFFPEQQLEPPDHVALGHRFGEIEIHPFIPKLSDEFKEIVVIDSEGAVADSWHTDVTFSPTPPMASILRMHRCSAVGGDTLFTNQYLAYETLSAPMRSLVDGLTAIHTATSFGHPELQAEHPAVRIHPETGRRSLFVNRTFTSHFPQLRPGESDALLEHLCAWSEQPQFQCRYHWAEGAIGIWDNRCTQHHAVGDYQDRRTIQRVTVLGDAPTGLPAQWPPFKASGSEVVVSRSVAARLRRPVPVDERTNSVS